MRNGFRGATKKLFGTEQVSKVVVVKHQCQMGNEAYLRVQGKTTKD